MTGSPISVVCPSPRTVLHVGCGVPNPDKLHALFRGPEWREIRLDVNPTVQPDIVGSMTDMAMLPDISVDAVWSSHSLEHLYAHEVPQALAEFRRVLRPATGFILLTLPDLTAIARLVAEGRGDEVIYQSSAGPVAGMDMLFGMRHLLAQGHYHMQHRNGFTQTMLEQALLQAGFAYVQVVTDHLMALWAVAYVEVPTGGKVVLAEVRTIAVP